MSVFVKQLGAKFEDTGNGIAGAAYRRNRTTQRTWQMINNHEVGVVDYLRSRKGGDPTEWPTDLRVREFPQ